MEAMCLSQIIDFTYNDCIRDICTVRSCSTTRYGPWRRGSSLLLSNRVAPVLVRGSRSARSPGSKLVITSGWRCNRGSCDTLMFIIAACCTLSKAALRSMRAFASPLHKSCGLGKYYRAAVPNLNSTGV